MTEAEQRKEYPVYSGVLMYFPDAIKEVAKCSMAGNRQHSIDHGIDPVDTDGQLHLAKTAWRALAALQMHLEKTK